MTQEPILSLLRSVRRRVWLEKSLRRLRLALWIGSFMLLAFAVASVFVAAFGPQYVVFAAAAGFLLVMGSAATLRPSLEEAALRADRHGDGDALFCTALELVRRNDESPAASFVTRQAGTRALQCKERLDASWAAPSPAGYALALIPIFAAVLLLFFAAVQHQSAPTSSTGAVAQTTDEYVLDDAEDLHQLRESIARNSATPAGQDVAEGENRTAGAQQGETRAAHEPTAAGDPPAGEALTTAGGGREAGDSVPGRGGPVLASPEFAQRSAIELARRGRTVAGTGAAAADSDYRQINGGQINGGQVSAATPPATVAPGSTLSPAQLAHAQRYFATTEPPRD